MHVLHHRPGTWFLLRQDGELFLDVYCHSGFTSFSLLLNLNEEERANYDSLGLNYTDQLANDIAYSGAHYRDRNQPEAVRELARSAIMTWKSRQVS